MSFDILKFLPNISRLRARLGAMEQQLADEYGIKVTLSVAGIDNTAAIDAIAKIVSDISDVPMKYLLAGSTQSAAASDARKIAMAICHLHIPAVKLKEIGDYFGRDHSTVIRSITSTEKLLSVEDAAITEVFNAAISALNKRIGYDTESQVHKA
jgi:chromosomal replication initiation ATPase DnaA